MQHFGKYLLDGEIAKGGMARVYSARLVGLGGFEKKLVVKQILPNLARDPRFIEMFVEEAKTLVRMSHPNIVPVYELGVIDGIYFLAMEHVDGATLSAVLGRRGAMDAAWVAHVGAQVCDALHFAHKTFGLVHRDVTPRNIMIDGLGQTRLLDFGIAAPAEGVETGEVFGSHGYMSPEQARAESVGPRSDLFSLGCVLFEALTAKPAFRRDNIDKTRAALLRKDPPSLTDEHGPPEIVAIINRLLQKEEANRPETAFEVAQIFKTWLAKERPTGVAEELGTTANEVRAERAAMPSAPPPSLKSKGPSTETSIATSAVLDRMIGATDEVGSATAPVSGRAPKPVDEEPASGSLGTVRIDKPAAKTNGAVQPPVATEEIAAPVAPPRARHLWIGGVLALAVPVGLGMALMAERGVQNGTAPVAAESVVQPANASSPLSTESAESTASSDANEPGTETTGDTTDPAPPPEPDPDKSTMARLSLNAVPWATVKVDGRSVGNTPKRSLSVRAGARKLTFRCPPLGAETTVTLQAKAGEHHHVVVDLNQVPPKVTKR